jgi:hypothetical protein
MEDPIETLSAGDNGIPKRARVAGVPQLSPKLRAALAARRDAHEMRYYFELALSEADVALLADGIVPQAVQEQAGRSLEWSLESLPTTRRAR